MWCSTNLLVGNGEPNIDGMYNISNPNHIISLKHLITQLVTTTPKCLHSTPMNSIISITMIATANKMILVALPSKPFVTNLAMIAQISMKTSINAKTDDSQLKIFLVVITFSWIQSFLYKIKLLKYRPQKKTIERIIADQIRFLPTPSAISLY